MREKLRPWIPAMFCAAISVITIIANLVQAFTMPNPTPSAPRMDFLFYCYLPMCFFLVGDFLSTLRREKLALRTQVDELSSQLKART